MSDPIASASAPEVSQPAVQPQSEPSGNVAPNIDNELDAALDKAFAPKPEIKIDEAKTPPVENKAPSNQPQPEQKKTDRPLQEDKPLASPESLEKDPPNKQAGWTALKNDYRRAHKIIESRDGEITRLKASLAEKGTTTQKEVETLKSQIEELSRFRAMVDIQADPEFVSKYDQPIERAASTIKEMLRSMNVEQTIVDQIDFTNTKLMDEIITHVGQHKDNFTARKLQRKVEELLDLSEKRDETLSDHKNKHKEYIENKKKESFNKSAEDEGKIIQRLKSIAEMKDGEEKQMFPFLNKVELKEGATQPEVEQANNHNKMVELMEQKVKQVLSMNSPEEKAEVAVAAVASHYLTAQLKTAIAKINGLQEEIKKISAIGSETVKARTPSSSRNGNGNQPQDVDSALNEFFSNRS